MNPRERQRITRTQHYLCNHISDIDSVMQHLFQNNLLTMGEYQRVRYEPSTSDQVRKILRILMKHPDGYCGLRKALIAVKMEFIVKTLDETCNDKDELFKDKDKLDELIKTVLKERFCETKGEVVYHDSIVEELIQTFTANGEDYYVHDDHIKYLIMTLFPRSENEDHKEKGYPF